MTDDISTILVDSAMLLLVGMSVVFVFLTLLIGAIHLIEWLCKKFPAAEEPYLSQPSGTAATVKKDEINPQVVAAISSAVHQYRNKK